MEFNPNEPKISTDRWNINQHHHESLSTDQKYYSKLIQFSQSWNLQKPLTNHNLLINPNYNNNANSNKHNDNLFESQQQQQTLINVDDDIHEHQTKNPILLSAKPISTSPLLSNDYGLRKLPLKSTTNNNETIISAQNNNLTHDALRNHNLNNNNNIEWQPTTDIDECLDERACGKGAICENLPGSFKCTCPPGFTGDPSVECIGKYH